MKRTILGVLLLVTALAAGGCLAPRIKLFSDASDPLAEHTLEGSAKHKVAVIPVEGFLSDAARKHLVRSEPSVVQEVVAQLRLAQKDKDVKAVLLTVNSPGGTITASDILYHEISRFKEQSKAKVVVCMMDMAASGGYYISLPADKVLAHPTTITGSVGVIFINPMVEGLFDKIGVEVEVTKSGANKDMGSPFRAMTDEEKQLMQAINDAMAKRFWGLVQERRAPGPDAMETVKTARIFTAGEALDLGLIDQVGYMDDALALAKKEAGLPNDARVVVYRRTRYPDDNLYNPSTMSAPGGVTAMEALGGAARLGPGAFFGVLLPVGAGGELKNRARAAELPFRPLMQYDAVISTHAGGKAGPV